MFVAQLNRISAFLHSIYMHRNKSISFRKFQIWFNFALIKCWNEEKGERKTALLLIKNNHCNRFVSVVEVKNHQTNLMKTFFFEIKVSDFFLFFTIFPANHSNKNKKGIKKEKVFLLLTKCVRLLGVIGRKETQNVHVRMNMRNNLFSFLSEKQIHLFHSNHLSFGFCFWLWTKTRLNKNWKLYVTVPNKSINDKCVHFSSFSFISFHFLLFSVENFFFVCFRFDTFRSHHLTRAHPFHSYTRVYLHMHTYLSINSYLIPFILLVGFLFVR